jgi:asparagine synthase (glutamine-hydrolysing)
LLSIGYSEVLCSSALKYFEWFGFPLELDLFKRSNLSLSSAPSLPTWWVAWNAIALRDECVVWRDAHLAILQSPSSSPLPFALSPNQRFVAMGEVWLYRSDELAQKLGTRSPPNYSPLQFVAALWEHFGTETFELLVGMFGLLVWDREQQVLWIGRDRSGTRTLYYTTSGVTRWIAPRLRDLNPYHAKELDPVALRDYLCCAFVPGEQTLWKQVREVRPGTIVQFPGEHPKHYWQLQEQVVHPQESLNWHGDRLRHLLTQVVQEYLPQHQPVGVLLSGGLDSSAITALAAQQHSEPVHTFSIHFGRGCPDELEFSSLVAEHCQTQHHILEITFTQMWEHLRETMSVLDDPIGDPLTVPNLLAGRLARQFVTVVLNGEGGDPCFGGPKNQPMLLNDLYGAVANQDALQAYLRSFQKCAMDLPQLLKPDVWAAVKDEPWVFSEDLASEASYLNRLMALNIKFKGADQILTKVSNLTQAAGLQGRSPLFDQRIVDLSMQIPPEYKLSGVREKAVLKQAVADLLPATIIHRPKSGMMVPVHLGFREYWNRQARGLLLRKDAAIAPYLNQSLIRDWLDYRGDTWGRYGVKLWLLASLELWLQANQHDP